MQVFTGHIQSPRWLWVASLAFVVVNAVFIAFEIYYLPLLPALLLFILAAFVRMDLLLLSIAFFVPLSLQLSFFSESVRLNLHLPTEPLLGMLLIIYILRYLRGVRSDLKILRHPVTLAIYFSLVWMLITVISSSDPLVSIKFFISRLWFVIGFYFIGVEVFRRRDLLMKYLWLYIISFSAVIIYTLIRHWGYGLNNQVMAHSMMQPFFQDHTSYGATLAFLLPVLIAFFLLSKKGEKWTKAILILLLLLFSVATVFSYTRAAWVSLIGGFLVWSWIRLRIRFEVVALTGAVLIALFFIFQPMILQKIESNRVQSSGDHKEHLQSIYNITNDQSNLERLNRWSCAIRMWKERPILGFGPGTYQFEYGRFQRSFERTEISTNFGTRGGAHSEYFGPLSESGLPGMISFIIIIVITLHTGIRVSLKARSRRVRVLALGILIGLVTYYIHGILNNFLDTDKASALFWGFTAMLVAMDLYQREEPESAREGLKVSGPWEIDTKD
jgi:O-antigen ligase